MESEPMAEQVTTIQPLTVEDFKRNPKIQRARKNLLVVIGIQLVWSISIILRREITAAHHWADFDALVHIIVFISIIAAYYIIFIIVVIKYSRLGLLIFTCLTMAGLIILIIGKTFIFIRKIYDSYPTEYRTSRSIEVVIFITVSSVDIVLLVLIIAFALKLAELIKRPTTNQIV